ncbi:MAG: hypothetical protein IPF66_13505 [Holophagales bacterium]|nr:hypothetical protein [Holophagales bacterium]
MNAGKYEFVVAREAVGVAPCALNTVGITGSGTAGGLQNAYTNADATGTKGQMRFQVVRVPQYTTATASGITALPWSTTTTGTVGLGTGGIVAIDVAGTLTLSGGVAIDADGAGFRGGAGRQLGGSGGGANTDWRTLSTVTTNGSKGEGIAGTPRWVQSTAPRQTNQPNDGYPNGSMARGAPANAGGGSTDGRPSSNDENSGGGGGSNGGAGGKGGYSWNSQLDTGGTGASVTPAVTKLVLGGGGGGGTRNDNGGDNLASGGAAGGGLVVIRAAQLSIAATATISSNGADAYDNTLNDGGGGGGAGGSVIVLVTSGDMSGLTLQARGGKGGSAWKTSAPGANRAPLNLGINAHGPGGGGGGGVIVYSSTAVLPAIDVAGGANGITTTALYPFGAQPGGTGQVLLAGPGLVPGAGSGSDCAPDPGVQLTHTQTTVSPGGPVTLLATVKNYSPFTSTSGTITVVITLDATGPGLTPTGASGSGWSCSIAGQQITCSRSDPLAPQVSYPVISISATVGPSGSTATLNNTATLLPTPGGDYNLTNNTSADPIGVRAPTFARLRSFEATRSRTPSCSRGRAATRSTTSGSSSTARSPECARPSRPRWSRARPSLSALPGRSSRVARMPGSTTARAPLATFATGSKTSPSTERGGGRARSSRNRRQAFHSPARGPGSPRPSMLWAEPRRRNSPSRPRPVTAPCGRLPRRRSPSRSARAPTTRRCPPRRSSSPRKAGSASRRATSWPPGSTRAPTPMCSSSAPGGSSRRSWSATAATAASMPTTRSSSTASARLALDGRARLLAPRRQAARAARRLTGPRRLGPAWSGQLPLHRRAEGPRRLLRRPHLERIHR